MTPSMLSNMSHDELVKETAHNTPGAVAELVARAQRLHFYDVGQEPVSQLEQELSDAESELEDVQDDLDRHDKAVHRALEILENYDDGANSTDLKQVIKDAKDELLELW